MSLSRLNAAIGKINDVLCAASVLVWDSRTMLPKGGSAARAEQLATLSLLARDLLLSDETRKALDGARREVETLPQDDAWRRAVHKVDEAIALHRRIPASLIERKTKARVLGAQIWVEARANSDFASFAPALADIVAVTRDYADAAGWSGHPYDVLIGLYEPGATFAEVRTLLDELKRGIMPILEAALGRPRPARDFLDEPFSEEKVKAAARLLTEVLGYDYEHGRLDKTVHPFAI